MSQARAGVEYREWEVLDSTLVSVFPMGAGRAEITIQEPWLLFNLLLDFMSKDPHKSLSFLLQLVV